MTIWRIVGFGTAADVAHIEAETPKHATEILAAQLTESMIDFNEDVDNWDVQQATRPLVLINFYG